MPPPPTKSTRRATATAAEASPPPQQWPADAVERRRVAELVPYARNARTHSDAQVAQIAASIKEWGWTTPVLVGEDGGIIAGHGRVLAARLLMIEDVPVMVARGWTEEQRRAYVIADNQLALTSGWNDSLLTFELNDLALGNFDTSLLGFVPAELDALMTGWKSDFDPIARDGETLDGISGVIRIVVKQEIEEQVRALVKAALDGAELAYDLR